MAFEAVSASGGEGLFPQHPRSGEFETLKGRMLAPYEMDVLESDSMGDSRHIDEAPCIPWDSTIIVNTGETRGGGTMAH